MKRKRREGKEEGERGGRELGGKWKEEKGGGDVRWNLVQL